MAPVYDHLIAGASGGVISTLLLHPLDLIKIRFAVGDGLHSRPKYSSMYDCARSVYKTTGIKGLYRGVTPNVVGNGASWGLYFFFYNYIKLMFDPNPAAKLSTPQYIACGCVAGSLTLTATNPIWICKTRMCLEYKQQYNNMWHVIRDLYNQNGIKGLYKGYAPGLIGTSHGAVQFLAYEQLKHWWYEKEYSEGNLPKMSGMECIVMSATSKVVAASSTYPYQVVRARMQDQHKQYDGIADVVVKTWRNEGWRGFYKGLGPSLIRVTPACCLTFYTYENITQYLKTTRTEKTEVSSS